jgi:hypothetical protein
VPQSVHGNGFLDLRLLQGRREAMAADPGTVARFAELVTEHKVKPALGAFLLPHAQARNQFGRNWNLPGAAESLRVKSPVFFLVHLPFHARRRYGPADLNLRTL